MNYLAPKLHLRVAQKQILTPGLVQMVSVLALNRLELREMINQEIMANPVLEELSDETTTAESYTDEAFLRRKRRTSRTSRRQIPLTNSISARFSRSIWIPVRNGSPAANTKRSKSPRSKNSSPPLPASPIIWNGSSA